MLQQLMKWGFAALAVSAVWAQESPAPAAPASGSKPDYVLQASDLLRVQIFQEDDLTREVRVSQENKIVLPLIGAIEVKGKNVREVQELVRALYDRDFLVNPQVNVFVLEYAKRSVNVIGSVNSPGVVMFPQEQGMNLLDAISRVGGFSRLADRRRVKLTRTTEGKTTTYAINVDDLIQGSATEPWVLVQDDVIFVPERIL